MKDVVRGTWFVVRTPPTSKQESEGGGDSALSVLVKDFPS